MAKQQIAFISESWLCIGTLLYIISSYLFFLDSCSKTLDPTTWVLGKCSSLLIFYWYCDIQIVNSMYVKLSSFPNSNVLRVESYRTMHSSCKKYQIRIPKGPIYSITITYSTHSQVLLHRKVRYQGYMILLVSFLGLTNGHLLSLSWQHLPKVIM